MLNFFFLIPISIGLGLVGLVAFFWLLNDGQYVDLEGAARRILFDDGEETDRYVASANPDKEASYERHHVPSGNRGIRPAAP